MSPAALVALSLLFGAPAGGAPAGGRGKARLLRVALSSAQGLPELELIAGVIERAGGRERQRAQYHDISPAWHVAYVLPGRRADFVAAELKSRLPKSALVELAQMDVDVNTPARAARYKRLVRAAEELGELHGQFPVLGAYLQWRTYRSRPLRAAVANGFAEAVVMVAEAEFTEHQLREAIKFSPALGGMIADRDFDPLSSAGPDSYLTRVNEEEHGDTPQRRFGEEDMISFDAFKAAIELRGLFEGPVRGSPAAFQAKLEALDAEAAEYPEFLAERPALKAVLREARAAFKAGARP